MQYTEIINTIKKCDTLEKEHEKIKHEKIKNEEKDKKIKLNNKNMKNELQKFMSELNKESEPLGLTSDYGSDQFQSF